MNVNYLKIKLKDYIKKNKTEKWKTNEWAQSDINNFIDEWLPKLKKTQEVKQLISAGRDDLEKGIEKILKKIKQDEIRNEIQEELEKLFTNNIDIHIGTTRLTAFYQGFGIDYSNVRERIKHSGRISKFKKKLKISNPLNYYLISGKIMKQKLDISYNNNVDGQSYEQIDGWCYTNKADWLEEFFEHEINKHKSLIEAYNHFKNRLP